MTSGQIKTALALKHPPGKWAFIPEMPFSTGFGKGSDNRIDGFAIGLWPSEGFKRHAFEIKVSRSDFLREMKNPKKHENAMTFSNYFWFVTPANLLKPLEVPAYAGLMEATELKNGKIELSIRLPATQREGEKPTWGLVCAMARGFERNTKAPAFHGEMINAQNEMRALKGKVKDAYLALHDFPAPWKWENHD